MKKEINLPQIADQLANSMEFYENEKEFAEFMNQNAGLTIEQGKTLFQNYYNLEPMERFELGFDIDEINQFILNNI